MVETVGEATWKDSLGRRQGGRPRRRLRGHHRPEPAGATAQLLVEALTVFGSTMGTRSDFLGAYELVRSGRVQVHVDSTVPLAEARAAHERMERGERLGKIVLTIP